MAATDPDARDMQVYDLSNVDHYEARRVAGSTWIVPVVKPESPSALEQRVLAELERSETDNGS